MKNIFCILTFSLIHISSFGQVGIDTSTVKASAILEISNSTNRAVIFPQVALTGVAFISPITGGTPVDGMIVYNTGGTLEKGYYIWISNTWVPLADRDNTVKIGFYSFDNPTTPYIFMAGVANNIYTNIPTANYTQKINQIQGLSYSEPNFTVSEGSYLMSVELNVSTSLENVNTGMQTGRTHRHVYEVRLVDSANNQIGDSQNIVCISRTTARAHRIAFILPFKTVATTSLTPQLRRITGSTYGNALGGTGANNGQLSIAYGILEIKKL
ncbi:hypothetical protein CHRY9390_03108 [Chryseobacterium aquaeductus]|uniref:Uncharacterized protein n=1 Tax=Chryseobacterium aquaeductus TaxID=2675056 RepID=A0A9N8MIH7_9FLAO|nr:hypothetical protein [Chryseobacterium aquaeductus]CAA7332386.1 hypothetical protein CHRY9390_03108 [Chryseobacterium potabilaquae]CAD7816139.1 hypothetical protein CHRY9390_03108 [Chryseobacterium aquaeductus]